MQSINDSHHLVFASLGVIHLVEGNYAEATTAFERRIQKSSESLGARFNAAFTLAAIELGEKAASYLEKTIHDAGKYWYKGNTNLYLSRTRAMFPRSENDSLGYWERAYAEMRAGNYTEAAKYFKLTKLGEMNTLRIYSYQKIGDIKESQVLLEKARLQLKSWLNVDAKYFFSSFMLQPIEIAIMEIAYLDGDIDKAVVNLKKAMERNYILNFEYKANSTYKKLREHPEWPSIMAESDKRAAVQRDIYLKLVAKEAETVH